MSANIQTIAVSDANSRGPVESAASAASWPAIFAGAASAAAASLVLVTLGSGIGMASISPWPHHGASAVGVSVMAVIWLIVVQWLSSLLGGYLTGRLRTKWVGLHTHEVFFRDTAHGFVTWALSTVLGAAFLASAVGATASKAVETTATAVESSAAGASGNSQSLPSVGTYELDRLFRTAKPVGTDAAAAAERSEAARILVRGASEKEIPVDDRDYLVTLVASRTGISETDARRRVDDAIAKERASQIEARQAADTARKAAATTSILIALSMVIGAFIAAASAALGGRLRDLHP